MMHQKERMIIIVHTTKISPVSMLSRKPIYPSSNSQFNMENLDI